MSKQNVNGRSSRSVLPLTIISITWLLFLAVAELVIGERNGITAMLAYMPQQPLCIPIVVSLLTSVFAKSIRWIILNIILAVIFLFVFMGLHISIPNHSNPTTIRVMTWNVNTSASNADNVMAVINKVSPDVVFMQEIKPGTDLMGRLKKGNWYIRQAGDIAVISRTLLSSIKIHDSLPGSTRKIITAKTVIKGRAFNLVGIHFATNLPGATRHHPSAYLRGSAKSRAMQARSLMEAAGESNTIIAGDFNMPPRGVVYRRLAGKYRNAFTAGIGFGYTYPSRLPLLRIDHIFTSRDLHPVSYRVIKTRASDHLPVLVEM